MIRHAITSALSIAYEEHGPADGPSTVLLHGFPYDVQSYEAVAPALAARGIRATVPWLRGYGPTRSLTGGRRDRASRRRWAAI